MPVKATCRSCQKVFQFPDWFLGRIVDCPNCKSPLLILPKAGGEATSVATTKVVPEQQAPAPASETTATMPGQGPLPQPPATPSLPSETASVRPEAALGVPAAPVAPTPTPAAGGEAATSLEVAATVPSRAEDVEVGSGSTSVSLLLSCLIGAVLTATFYLLYVLPMSRFYLGQIFWDRGPTPYFTMLLTFWSAAHLFLKWRKTEQQKASLGVDVLPLEISEEITPDNTLLFLEHAWALRAKWPSSFFVNRVLKSLTLFGSGRSVQEVAALGSSQADIDATAIVSSYKMVKVFIWAIPILGFIGTVLGIGQAVGGFSSAIARAQELDVIRSELGHVTAGLGVAFDTTLVALVMSILIMLPMSWLQTSEEELLNRVEEFCNENLLRRLNERREAETLDSAPVAEALRAGLSDLKADLQANSGRATELGTTVAREIAAAWGDVRQKLDKDNKDLIHQLQELLRAISASEAHATAEHQKRMEEINRRLQFVTNLSSERLDTAIKTGAGLTDAMNRSHEKLAEQTRQLAELLQGQQILGKSQEVLTRNLAAVQASGQLLTTMSNVSQLIGQLTPVLDRLAQQVDRLAAAQSDGGTRKRSWFGWR